MTIQPHAAVSGQLGPETVASRHFLLVKHADLDATASGNTQVVATVTGKRIRVISVLATNGGGSDISINFQSSTTEITATHMLANSGGGYARDAGSGSWLFQTAVGEALNINLSGVGTVGVDITYVEVA